MSCQANHIDDEPTSVGVLIAWNLVNASIVVFVPFLSSYMHTFWTTGPRPLQKIKKLKEMTNQNKKQGERKTDDLKD